MRAPAFSGLLVAAFAAAVGHVGWHAFWGPPVAPKYHVGGTVPALVSPDPEAKQLYLRRNLYLSQRPRRAWIQVLARDWLRVHVNGKRVAEQELDGFTVAFVLDLAPWLRVGHNAIIIATRQDTLRRPPVVAVEGAYTLTDGEHPLRGDASWRCNTYLQRRATWEFEPDFDDRHWPFAGTQPCFLRGEVKGPPRAVTEAGEGRWITPLTVDEQSANLCREFELAGRPQQAWLRLTTSASYRLAVNGIRLDQQEQQLATPLPNPPVQYTYDITPVVQAGSNVLALVLTSTAGPPHVRADLEVEDTTGRRYRLGTDSQWRSRPGRPADWPAPPLARRAGWQACAVEAGDLDIPPWLPPRQLLAISLPWPVVLRRLGEQVVWMVVIGLVTALACRGAARGLAARAGEAERPVRGSVAYLALVLPTLALAAAVLATYDPRLATQEVYRSGWVVLAGLSLPLQWGLLALLGRWRRPGRPAAARLRAVAAGLVCLLLAVGFWLRVRDLPLEPLHSDEVTILRASRGLTERYFPSFVIHPDVPVYYISGCELECVGPALASLVFADDHYVARMPSVFWGTLVIGLIYLAGRGLFNAPAGLIAAALYTFSPLCIHRANFGRYPCLLQFMTLLTVYAFLRTIRGSGRLERRWLFLTALSFVAMYLSWEGSALVAVGMVLAALLQRRGHLGTILYDPAVYAALGLVLAVVLLQNAHNALSTSQFLLYGTGWSDITLRPMWRFPFYNALQYVGESSWNLDAFLPMLGLLGAGLVAIRHPFRRALRALLVIFLTACLVMSSFLSVVGGQYAFHLIPLLILLAAAALSAAARWLARLARPNGGVSAWGCYAHGVAALAVAAVVALGSGMTVQLAEMPLFSFFGSRPDVLKYPNLEKPLDYLGRHIQEGDVVIAMFPETADYYMALQPGSFGSRTSDYWLESTLQLVALLDDRRTLPSHRWTGTVMLPNLQSVQDVFARHNRIWYIAITIFQEKLNAAEVSAFLRQHMDVVYEDYQSMVLLRDTNHRTAANRLREEAALEEAQIHLLP